MMHDHIPFSLLPNLEEYGIEEIERGVCADTQEHRKILRYNRLNAQIQYDPETGEPTGNLFVVSPKMAKEAAEIRIRRRADLLQDPADPNSDYLAGHDLLLVPDVESAVPAAVLMQTKRVRDREARDAKAYRDGLGPKKLDFRSGGAYEYPVRCTAYRNDMMRCLNWTNGVDKPAMCGTHLKREERRPSVAEQVANARTRILEMSLLATEVMGEILEDPEAPAATRLKAATELLDRSGIRGGIEIETKVEVSDNAAKILERLEKLRPREVEPAPEEPLDAEVVVVQQIESEEDEA